MGTTIHNIPVNRVEGDLEVRVAVTDGRVTDAWSSGTLYRGFENIMTGRSPMDGLVITPRICGICSTAHLKAAARALDMFYRVRIPDTARRIRNVALGVEMLQNDVRHANLLFMSDFANRHYADHPLYDEAVARYQPLKGRSALETITRTAQIIEIIAVLGGQWPHSSFMVPGGVVSAPSVTDVGQCINLLRSFRKWVERRFIGCSLERWRAVTGRAELEQWLGESAAHRESDLGFFIRFARQAGLDAIGRGYEQFIAYGALEMPEETEVTSFSGKDTFLTSGFAEGTRVHDFSHKKVTEDLSSSWFRSDGRPQHPFAGRTVPYATGGEAGKYTWAKAPRYDGKPAETGPLAQMVISGIPLFHDLIRTEGASAFTRELARMVRPVLLIPALETWLTELLHRREQFYRRYRDRSDGRGVGLVEAPRGALGHWIRIRNQQIENYQIITPTAWNASPRDGHGRRGCIEEALIGTPVPDPENMILPSQVIRSFDPCLVCTVHAIQL